MEFYLAFHGDALNSNVLFESWPANTYLKLKEDELYEND